MMLGFALALFGPDSATARGLQKATAYRITSINRIHRETTDRLWV